MWERTLEIEHKFAFDSSIIARMVELGASLDKEQFMIDEYYDDPDSNFLTLNDYWLRLRSWPSGSVDVWQLKYPPLERNVTTQGAHFNTYLETENRQEILKIVLDLYKRSNVVTECQIIRAQEPIEQDFESILFNMIQLKPICRIESRRRSYHMDNDLRIDLDETNFGYNCGEIEIMLDKNASCDEIKSAYEKIALLATKLGKTVHHYKLLASQKSIYNLRYTRVEVYTGQSSSLFVQIQSGFI